MREAVIVDCLRTPVGKAPRGALRNTRPDDLGALVIRALLEKYPAAKDAVEDVILGCAMPEGEAGANMARQSALRAGLPDPVPAMTINRFCSSGLQALALAADRIRAGSADCLVAAGAAFHAKGTVTAGNSSQTSDGAAAALVMSEKKARALGLKPMARFASYATAGVPPEIMGIGPVVAIPKALVMADLTLDEIGVI